MGDQIRTDRFDWVDSDMNEFLDIGSALAVWEALQSKDIVMNG